VNIIFGEVIHIGRDQTTIVYFRYDARCAHCWGHRQTNGKEKLLVSARGCPYGYKIVH
jgi:hypothetical protein